MGWADPGRGSDTWGRREGTLRPRYLLILCAKARRSAAAIVPRVQLLPPPPPPPRGPSLSRTLPPRPGSRQPGWAGRGRSGRRGPSGCPGRSVLPLPAGGARSPCRPRALGAEMGKLKFRGERAGKELELRPGVVWGRDLGLRGRLILPSD